MTPSLRWRLVVPVKEAHLAKTRLETPSTMSRPELARAMALDTLESVCRALPPADVITVTSDEVVSLAADSMGAVVVADPGGGLNAAVQAGIDEAARGATPRSGTADLGIAVLLGDLPALRPSDLLAALAESAEHDRAVVPDLVGTGTVLLTGTRGSLPEPHFGDGSAHRHAELATVLTPALPRLRQDVDDRAGLAAATALGLGPRTTSFLVQDRRQRAAAPAAETSKARTGRTRVRPMQGTVHTFDPATTTGSVILDTGKVVPFEADAFGQSGLRHLRVGQRLSIEVSSDPEGPDAHVTRLWIVGIGADEAIH